MKDLFTFNSSAPPQVMTAEISEGNGVKSLIVMGVVLVAFVIIFVLVSKKLKKK